jgi:hypothetical protein
MGECHVEKVARIDIKLCMAIPVLHRFEVYHHGLYDNAPESLDLPAIADRDARLRKIDWKKRVLLDLLVQIDRDIGHYEREVMEAEGIRAVVNLCHTKGIETICHELSQIYREATPPRSE